MAWSSSEDESQLAEQATAAGIAYFLNNYF